MKLDKLKKQTNKKKNYTYSFSKLQIKIMFCYRVCQHRRFKTCNINYERKI